MMNLYETKQKYETQIDALQTLKRRVDSEISTFENCCKDLPLPRRVFFSKASSSVGKQLLLQDGVLYALVAKDDLAMTPVKEVDFAKRQAIAQELPALLAMLIEDLQRLITK